MILFAPKSRSRVAPSALVRGSQPATPRSYVTGCSPPRPTRRPMCLRARPRSFSSPVTGAKPLTPDVIDSLPSPLALIVPDGNWRQASRMVKRLPLKIPAVVAGGRTHASDIEGSGGEMNCFAAAGHDLRNDPSCFPETRSGYACQWSTAGHPPPGPWAARTCEPAGIARPPRPGRPATYSPGRC